MQTLQIILLIISALLLFTIPERPKRVRERRRGHTHQDSSEKRNR